MLGNYITIFPRCQRKKTCFAIFFPVSSALPQARILRQERRAGPSRPTGGMVHEGRAATETRPYGAISVLRDMATTAATKPRLSLQNQTEPRKCRRGESQTRPSPLAGRSLVHPVGEGLAPPAGFRNLFGQRCGCVLRGGAPGRRALRTSWSAEGGRPQRAAPTGQFRSWAMRWPPQP